MPHTQDGIEKQRRFSAQGVHENRRHAHRHRGHRPDRENQAGCGNRHADAVEGDRQADVLHHLAIAPAADLARVEQRIEPVAEDDDVGRIDGDVGSPAHGNAHIGLHEGRGIVDAITDHGDLAALLQRADQRDLVLRQQPGMALGDTGRAGHMARGGGVVAADHHGLDAESMQCRHRARGFGAQRVAKRQHSEQLLAAGDQHHRAPQRFERFGAHPGGAHVEMVFLKQAQVADQDGVP